MSLTDFKHIHHPTTLSFCANTRQHQLFGRKLFTLLISPCGATKDMVSRILFIELGTKDRVAGFFQ